MWSMSSSKYGHAVLVGCALIIALAFICGALYYSQEMAKPHGVLIDKAHNVTTNTYYLYIRTEEGDRQCRVGRSLFFASKIGEEVDLSEEGR